MKARSQQKYLKNCISFILSSCLVSAANAAETSINEAERKTKNDEAIEVITVVGAVSRYGVTKSNTPIVETARSLSIETSADFFEKGALNLSQTTSYMAGVSAETFGFATRGDWIRARGLELPRYRDSIQELFGSYNSTRPDIYTIEQVEVLRGPASVLYGQGSPGGIVNYVSKTPRSGGSFGQVDLQLGNFNRQQVALDYNTSLNTSENVLGRFVGVYRDTDTQVDFVDEQTLVLMPSISFMPSDDTTITAILLHQDTKSDTGSQFIPVNGTLLPLDDGTYLDQDVYAGEPNFNRYNTKSTQLTLLGEHVINDAISFNTTALWRDGEADYHQAWPTFLGAGNSRYLNDIIGAPLFSPTTVARSFYQADNTFEQLAFDGRFTAQFVFGEVSHDLILGAQYQHVETDNNVAYFYGGGALTGDFSYVLDLNNPQYTGAPDQAVFDAIYNDQPVQKVNDLGIYLSDQISYEAWRITLGLRYDTIENDNGTAKQDDNNLSMSAGLLYRFDNGFAPYINYAESFETVVGINLSGEQFKPEEAEQVEIGVKYELQALPGYITLAYYDIEISNLPNPNALPATSGQQLGVSTLDGVELEGKLNFGDLALQFAYSTVNAEDPNGFALAGIPDKNASAWLSWEPSDFMPNTRFGFGIRHVGMSVSEQSDLRYETPSFTLGDLMMGYTLSENWELSFNIRNISDKKYLTSCLTRGDCFPGLRRSINATIAYNF
ncbi:TonB-dependent siderophore receptor [Glaciecola sp. MH2013]|nr:TonB-dependent siderophore receptor [Glaciecola sp. MH2013]